MRPGCWICAGVSALLGSNMAGNESDGFFRDGDAALVPVCGECAKAEKIVVLPYEENSLEWSVREVMES